MYRIDRNKRFNKTVKYGKISKVSRIVRVRKIKKERSESIIINKTSVKKLKQLRLKLYTKKVKIE